MFNAADMIAPFALNAVTLSAAPTNSAAFTTKSYESVALRCALLLLSGGTSVQIELEESDDGATGWAVIPGSRLAMTADETLGQVQIRTQGRKRYIRASAAGVGGSPTYMFWIEGLEPRRPEDQPSAAWNDVVL